jgi:uncharacterized protein YbjQ (UPF0145 family)
MEMESVMNQSDNKLSSENLYREAYSAHESGDRETLLRKCGVIFAHFPTSREAEWAVQNFGVTPEDLVLMEVPTESNVILTTAPWIEGYRVTKTLEIITSECVFGMNIIRDMFSAVVDVFGGRSNASQKVLHDARKLCLSELKRQAIAIGANAVIAVDLDYSEFSGGGKSMLFLVASGTAVQIERLADNFLTGKADSKREEGQDV